MINIPKCVFSFGKKVLSYLFGKVQEWFNWHAWKACVLARVPWVRIPPFPLIFFTLRISPIPFALLIYINFFDYYFLSDYFTYKTLFLLN